ncbi:lipoprotein [Spiroplasma phoeniceum]|uniref:Lipoprotein n=1 Tax=Spiroplasma phoeniceum P40 TaxID=1276259 RepID=A0A345DSQ9_9MOLU|nr:lipoprotein [Spiroplasma phoeniceum]AXF97204.1 hypothetical protein SDAV_003007 [Spiroplasma phoeniceum P40]AXF97250.1 hypothetical protein SDAV_003055 [Spiroplasma phoeniceum P40]
MKKILSLIGAVSLTAAGASSVVACLYEKKKEYTDKELLKLKEINKIDTANQEIKENLEWISPKEEPFNIIDNYNHYFYVVWRGDENYLWRIIKFKYNSYSKVLDTDIVNNSIALVSSEQETYLVVKDNKTDNYILIESHYIVLIIEHILKQFIVEIYIQKNPI